MGILDRFKRKGRLTGTIELHGLPANCGYSVSVSFVPVNGESSPPPSHDDSTTTANTEQIFVKEKEAPEQSPLTFNAHERVGFYYVDVGLIVYFEREGDMFAQVEHFIPMRAPCRIEVNQTTRLNLIVSWPNTPFEELHSYGTVYPQ
jgi:hypothetical protein